MLSELLSKNNYNLQGLDRINILIGKNGCGKSTVLRKVEEALSADKNLYQAKYITPERSGTLQYEPGVEHTIVTNVNWLPETRRGNQFGQFRQQSMVQYRKLEILCLREIEAKQDLRKDLSYKFDTTISKINSLLDNVEIKREESDFGIYAKKGGKKLNPKEISSGESELISLGIECLSFQKECKKEKSNFLFLDEPDVHLHPDLQYRLVHFLHDLVRDEEFQIVVATHSTAFLGACYDYSNVRIAFMTFDQKDIVFQTVSDVYRKILPVFGAHPLSNIFNESPILLVDGEDDERIWQQAIRTAKGNLKLFPCSVDGSGNFTDYEEEILKVIKAVYDSAKAYSLRDRDDGTEDIDDKPPIVRCKLSCRTAENLLLSNDVLQYLGTSWDEVKLRIEKWLDVNEEHIHFNILKSFYDEGFPRKSFDIKEIRNDLMGIMGSSKPWEVAVGQVIGKLNLSNSFKEDSLASYLGEKIVKNIFDK